MIETLVFVQWPLLAALLAGSALTFYGVFLVERRMVFLSVTLGQAAVCGAASGFMFHFNPRLGGILAVALAILILSLRSRKAQRPLPEDSVLGILFVIFGALAVAFLSKSAHGGIDETSLLFGSLLGVTREDVLWLVGVVGLLSAAQIWGYRRILAVTFDAETSRILGMNTTRYELLFFAGLGLLLAVTIAQMGVLLCFAFLVLPGASARFLSRGMVPLLGLSAALAVAGSVAGTLASIHWDLPTGAAICLALAAPLPFAWALRRRR